MDRALFIIDDKGILRQITINDRPVGRSVSEACRLINEIQHADKLHESTSTGGFPEGKKNKKYV
jgi:alkyl hydroperoxide reductase subunit AhpC